MLEGYQAGTVGDEVDDETLWEARTLIGSLVHPETGAEIPRPLTMAAFVPANIAICLALLSSTSVPAVIASQVRWRRDLE